MLTRLDWTDIVKNEKTSNIHFTFTVARGPNRI